MEDHASIRTRVVHVRQQFRAKIDAVQRGLTHAGTYVADPWVQLGAAAAVGYLLGREERTAPIARTPQTPETIVHAVVRAALVTFVSSAIRRAMPQPAAAPPS